MSTFTQILYHIVFSTKNRDRTLSKEKRKPLFEYIWGILNKKNCHLYRMNGIEDHIHIATSVHPTVNLSSLVKDIKLASSAYINDNNLFRNFSGLQDGYAAFTYSFKEKDRLIEYIKNQEEHHKQISFKDELREILIEHGVQFEEKYLL